MKILCPKCGSGALPEKKGQAIGSIIGITSGGLAALIASSRETEGGNPIERAATILLNVLAASSFGGITGSRVGKLIDENIFPRYQCSKCGNLFRR